MPRRGGFLRLLSAGHRVVDAKGELREGWHFAGKLVLPGYHAQRTIVVSPSQQCTADLRVFIGSEDRPVFLIRCACNDSVHGTEYGHAARPVIENYLVSCGAKQPGDKGGKRWNGPSFFCFDRADVSLSIHAAAQLPPISSTIVQEEYEALCPDHDIDVSVRATPGVRAGDIVRWAGIIKHGELVESPHWLLQAGAGVIYLCNGFTSQRSITTPEGNIEVTCSIQKDKDMRPVYKCCWKSGDDEQQQVSSGSVNGAVQQVFATLTCHTRHQWHWDGVKFFGLDRLKVSFAQRQTEEDTDGQPSTSSEQDTGVGGSTVAESELAKRIRNIRRRNRGRSSQLAGRQNRKNRMEVCEKAVDLITFGDLQDFVKHLVDKYPDVVDKAIDSSPAFTTRLSEKLADQPRPVFFPPAQCGELLMGVHCLSERAYKNTRRILLTKNVHIARYDDTVKYLKSLDVGSATTTPDGHGGEACEQCFTWDLRDTLHKISSEKELFEKFQFPSEAQQKNLFTQLQERRPDVYANLNGAHRTLFIRQTGDNYRAALKKQPTQQMSMCLLNMKALVYSPLGQFVLGTWRGGESRSMIRAHMTATFQELDTMAREGVTLKVPGDQEEHFNVVVLYVSDFSHTKEILGRVQVTAEQGCPMCNRPSSTWHRNGTAGKPRRYQDLAAIGAEAEETIGVNPDKDSAAYKSWYKENQGQTGRPLVDCLCPETCPPCALHLHLALHRSLWKKISVVVKSRDQEDQLPSALSSIGCTYLSFQVAQYFKNKKKSYDGSDTLRMTGIDCIRLEEQIEKFVTFFVRPGQNLADASCMDLRQLVELFQLTRAVTKEMRALETTYERIQLFRSNVKKLFVKIEKCCPSESLSKIPYVHTLRDHVADIMEFWFCTLGWGYGYLSCMASEHLNKLLKEVEYEETNFGSTSLHQAVVKTRVRAFHYPSTLFSPTNVFVCSACQQAGHNRKNKLCPMKRPHVEIESSDDENT